MSVLEELARGEFVKEGITASMNIYSDRKLTVGNHKLKGTTPEQLADLKKLKNDIKKEIQKDNPDYNIGTFDQDFESKLKTYLETESMGSFEMMAVPMYNADKLIPIFNKHGYSLYVDGTMLGTVLFNGRQAKEVWVKGYNSSVITEVLVYKDQPMLGNHIKLGKKQKVTLKVMCFKTKK